MEEGMSLYARLRQEFDLKEVDIRTYSPLALAYIGDGVYDLVIRTVIVGLGNRPANSLHKIAVTFVNAQTQSAMIQSLLTALSEEELAVYKRGRNAKFHTKAKNATYNDYCRATGFEALIGYLYLQERMDRILALVKMGLHNIEDPSRQSNTPQQ